MNLASFIASGFVGGAVTAIFSRSPKALAFGAAAAIVMYVVTVVVL